MNVFRTQKVILHVSDWNYQDKYYEMTRHQLNTFRNLIQNSGIEKAWEWLVDHTLYPGEQQKKATQNIKFGVVDMTLDSFFLDYSAAEESMAEWGQVL